MRLLRPEDVRDAAEWYLGISLRHVRASRPTMRVAQAKRIYWAALRELGMSYDEIADVTGAERSSVTTALRRNPPAQCYVDGVLARALEQVELECASQLG